MKFFKSRVGTEADGETTGVTAEDMVGGGVRLGEGDGDGLTIDVGAGFLTAIFCL